MKKKILFAVFSVSLCIAVAIMYSCSKDEPANQQNEYLEMQLKSDPMTEEGHEVYDRLVAFKEELELYNSDPNYQSASGMTAEEALIEIESYFNARYCRGGIGYPQTFSDNLNIELVLAGDGLADMNSVFACYEKLVTEVRSYYEQINETDKEIVLVDLSKGASSSDGINVNVFVVCGNTPPGGGISTWQPFGEDDDWHFGETAGRCDFTNPGTDGAEKLEAQLNYFIPRGTFVPTPPAGYHYIYIPDLPLEFEGNEPYFLNPDDPTPGDNEVDYLIFYCSDVNGTITADHECMIPDEMNFYYFSQLKVFRHILPEQFNKPDNWVFMYCNLDGIEITSPIGYIHHKNTVNYGYRMLIPDAILGRVNIID